MSTAPSVLIVECGSQYTPLIQRTLRESGYRSAIVRPNQITDRLALTPPKAIIISGSFGSVNDGTCPQPPEEILQATRNGRPIPILGICFGMQWLAHACGGKVTSNIELRDYGSATIMHDDLPNGLFNGLAPQQQVWMSHGDTVARLPSGFIANASHVESGAIAAIHRGHLWGIQFHPEVTDTPCGHKILKNFMRLADCLPDWEASSVVEEIRAQLEADTRGRRAIIGFSGGVDSTVLTAIAAPVLRERLLAVTIDGDHLRANELAEIRASAKIIGVEHTVVEAKMLFQKLLADTIDAEEKRSRFRSGYRDLLHEAARGFGADLILQGTLAPDRIESGHTGGEKIKSHHNVGLDFGLDQLHPLQDLYKYEVRALAGQALGLPKTISERQPFPGPGFFLRVVYTPATTENLAVVRWADAQVKEILVRRKLYDQISQLVVALLGIPTVGVKGDARVYGPSIAVRPVKSTDFMTSQPQHLPKDVEDEICSVVTRHSQIVRVLFDYTRKPPATTEFE